MTVYEALFLMITFGMFIVGLIGLVIVLIKRIKK